MAITTHVLVVANQTVDAPQLLSALEERARSGPIDVTLLVPVAYAGRAAAQERADAAVAALRAAGIEARAVVAHEDPIVAVQEEWHPARYDEVVVSTLAAGTSRWLNVGLPDRVAKLTDCPVRHVEVREVRVRDPRPRREPEHHGVLDTAMSFLAPRTR